MTNLDCKDIKALLSGLVDGEVDGQIRHQAERHLVECKACRDLLNEAEGVNELVALDAQRMMWPVGLPAGFEQAVLKRTIYGDALHFAGRRWTSWLGWVAAAACLLLTVSIWILDHQVISRGQNPVAVGGTRSPSSSIPEVAFPLRSYTYNGGLPDGTGRNTRITAAALSMDDKRAIDDDLSTVLSASHSRAQISRDDSDTLYAASNLLDMLAQSDVQNFSDVERIRQVAEYDNLLDRLADARMRLSASDRPAVLAAESVLLRIVQGPISLDDLRILHDTVASMGLPEQMVAISSRWSPASSL